MNARLQTTAGSTGNQDRGAVIDCGSGLVLVVADGAGGRSGGTEAAVLAVELVRRHADQLFGPASCADLLRAMDHQIDRDRDAGETTCAVAVVKGDQVFGASVGDSGVWMIGPATLLDLSALQSRKPFVGSGNARPVEFSQSRGEAETLLLATDGLLKYTSRERIIEVCRKGGSHQRTPQLIDLVRYPSGALPDDVTVILVDLS